MAQAWPRPALYKYAQTGEHRECFLRPPAATITTSTVTMIKAVLLLCTLALLVLATQAAVVR